MKRQKTKRTRLTKRRQTRKRQTGGALCGDPPLNKPNTTENNSSDIYTLGEVVEGSTWYLYSAEGNPSLLIKKVGGVNWLTKETIEEEFKISKIAAALGVGPAILFTRHCTNEKGYPIGFIVMEKIEGRTLEECDTEYIDEANKLLKILNDNGIRHNDTHFRNAMIGKTATHTSERVWIIDYGEASFKTQKKYEILSDE